MSEQYVEEPMSRQIERRWVSQHKRGGRHATTGVSSQKMLKHCRRKSG